MIIRESDLNDLDFNGQAHQDKFIVNVLNAKRNGIFLEIGSSEPVLINNTFILEKEFAWRGFMIERNSEFLSKYRLLRPRSIHVMQDATTIDYSELLNDTPRDIDYLQIDLEPLSGSTLKVLEMLDDQVFDKHSFAVVTFEHDIYDNNFETRTKSRCIFDKRGYVRVFSDVSNDLWWKVFNLFDQEESKHEYPFEDWYVYPPLVDMTYIEKLIKNNRLKYSQNSLGINVINCFDIEYHVR